jgi:hypothetical protein
MDEDYILKEYFERWAVEFVDEKGDVTIVSVLVPKADPGQERFNEDRAMNEAMEILEKAPFSDIRERANSEISRAYKA